MVESSTPAQSASPPTLEQAIAQVRAQQNFAAAVPVGIVAAIVGAGLWAVTVYATEMKLGLVAIAVGALVGYAVRTVGKGIEQKFGILGAICAALGWGLGTMLSDVAFLAKHVGRSFGDVLMSLGLSETISFVARASDAMDLLFLGIAVYEGYKLSFRYRLKKGVTTSRA
jgi:hypothetical protein